MAVQFRNSSSMVFFLARFAIHRLASFIFFHSALMKNYAVIIVALWLSSCSQNCSECERKLHECASATPMVLNLPKPAKPESDDAILTIQVNANDQYVYEEKEYSLDEITSIINRIMKPKESHTKELRINGDKKAHYEAIFALITFARTRDIKPILVFKE